MNALHADSASGSSDDDSDVSVDASEEDSDDDSGSDAELEDELSDEEVWAREESVSERVWRCMCRQGMAEPVYACVRHMCVRACVRVSACMLFSYTLVRVLTLVLYACACARAGSYVTVFLPDGG